MTIEGLLKEGNARLSIEDKWLVWWNDEWLVLQRPPYKKANRCLYSGENLDIALETLKGDS